MSVDHPSLKRLIDQIQDARHCGTQLWIEGGASKAFYGAPRPAGLNTLSMTSYQGILNYDPSELVIVARAGTPLAEIESCLAEHEQVLAFEPPRFSVQSTFGGVIAAGLSGPRRLQVGALRDFVLGASLLRADGEVLGFGGTVMKNVAGYDLSRLLAGSLGYLGPILDVAIKVLPRPQAVCSLRFECDQATMLQWVNAWGAQPLPLAATAWHEGQLTVRLAGARAALAAARSKLGGEALDDHQAETFWQQLRDQQTPWFQPAPSTPETQPDETRQLWRLSLPSTTPALPLPGDINDLALIEWGGGLRWYWTGDSDQESADKGLAAQLRDLARRSGGHASLYRSSGLAAPTEFQNLEPGIKNLHRQLKAAFDPEQLFNPGQFGLPTRS